MPRARAGVDQAVTIFGSARVTEDDPHYQAAEETAYRLARRKFAIITGAGPGIETIEPKVVMRDGEVVELRQVHKNRARELIEDVMIAANGVTARFLADRGLPSLRRVIRSPKRWDRIVDLARSLGTELPKTPDAVALEAFLVERRRADPLRFPDLPLSVVKMMGAGEYVAEAAGTESAGHFGLAVRDYVHSTAPNRRYPDLVTQRLLKAAIAGTTVPYDLATLQEIATHCTTQENAADKVERQVRKSAAALLLSSRLGDRFDAIVTGASPKGHVGPGAEPAGRRPHRPRLRRPRRRRPRAREARERRRRPRLHRFRALNRAAPSRTVAVRFPDACPPF